MSTVKTITTEQAIQNLLDGGVGIMPTDTVYGIVACANNQVAAERLYTVKYREHKPGTIIAATVDQLVALGIKKRYLSAVEQWWPNPLSVVIPTGEQLAYLHRGKDSLAVRIPNDPDFIQLLKKTGPLLTSSANQPGETPANTLDEAYAYFKDTVDFYVDGEGLSNRAPSTIIRVVDDAIEVLREGSITFDEFGHLISKR